MQPDKKSSAIQNRQFYRQADDGQGKPRYYDIEAMLNWAQKNAEINLIKTDSDRASRLVQNSEVNTAYVRQLLSQGGFSPILLCLQVVNGDGDQIVDGNHRYVASCYKAEINNRVELVPAYLLKPEEWNQFVVPPHEVAQHGLIDPHPNIGI